MKNRILTSKMVVLTLVGAGLFATSCSKDSGEPTPLPETTEEVFHVAYGVGTEGIGSTSSCVMKPFSDLTTGSIDIGASGFKVSESRTDRVYTSADGKLVYSLQYQAGTIKKIETVSLTSDPFYQQLSGEAGERNLVGILGSTSIRWKKIDDNTALAYDVEIKHLKTDGSTYSNTTATLHITAIDLNTLSISPKKSIELVALETDTSLNNLHTWRVDSPVVLDGKVYIGVAKRGYDGAKNDNISSQKYKTSTLVLDYPSLDNPKFIYSEKSKGEAYGYRTAPYFTYNGSVYHNTTNETKILKITNGVYDESYVFDLATALGMNKVGASGMFHVGNGIGYVVFYDAEKGTSWGSSNKYWGIARVDLNAKTAVKMDLPENLWLAPLQSGKLGKDGKFYLPIAPLNTDGNIYIFDPTSTSPTGYTKGATLKISGDAFYLGVF